MLINTGKKVDVEGKGETTGKRRGGASGREKRLRVRGGDHPPPTQRTGKPTLATRSQSTEQQGTVM